MIYFYEHLKNRALQLIQTKKTGDELKAGMYLSKLNDMMKEVQAHPCMVQAALELHTEINQEYPEIQMLFDAAEAIHTPSSNNNVQQFYNNNNTMYEALKADSYGILAHVLIKHNLIQNIENFIKWVD